MERKDIKGLSREELECALVKNGFARFSSSQVFNWLYKKRVEDVSLMTDLSKKLRADLNQDFCFSSLEIKEKKISKDNTTKFLFRLDDDYLIETVMIPEEKRDTVCVSTQVGCKFKCVFCLSGQNGFKRNLTTAEIINQFLKVQDSIAPKNISNIVFMGVGEPLDNFDNVIKAINIIMDNKGLYLGKRKICISTSGLVPQINKLIELDLGVKLSVSLHSASEAVRSQLMPVNKKYPLSELMKVLREFVKKERSPVTFEYVLIRDLNSSRDDALRLAGLVKGIKCKLNLILYNPSPYFKWQAPSAREIEEFRKTLKDKCIFSTLRKSRGQDIEAACGQLRAQFKD